MLILSYIPDYFSLPRYLDGEDLVLRLKKEDDPFWEPVEDLFLGLGNFFLQKLSYRMDFEDKCYITDYKVKIESKIIRLQMILLLN